MGVGRFFCVALPFILTVCSVISLLVACLGGVTNKGLYMFQVNTTDLSLSPASIRGLISGRDIIDDAKDFITGIGSDAKEATGEVKEKANAIINGDSGSNVTGTDLGLGDFYDISLWGYCTTTAKGERECTEPKFNWASSALNTSIIDAVSATTGQEINIPDEITTALKTFSTVSKWTQVAFFAAFGALALQLLIGLFSVCSRGVSCVTWLVSGLATLLVIAAASLATATSAIVVGVVKSTARFYGVEASLNTTFLVFVWLAAAFAIASAFFWIFTICCCAPDRSRSYSKRQSNDAEKLLPTGAYQPLNDPHMSGGANYYANTQYGAPRNAAAGPRSDMAYEPYSHRS